jgi:hypothetical protein
MLSLWPLPRLLLVVRKLADGADRMRTLEQQGDVAGRARCQQEESRERAHSAAGLVAMVVFIIE